MPHTCSYDTWIGQEVLNNGVYDIMQCECGNIEWVKVYDFKAED